MSDLNPTDLEEIADAELAQKARAEQVARLAVADLKWLMSSKQGRRIVWQLLASTGIYRTSMHDSATWTAFNEGQRNVGLKLNGQIMEHCPLRYAEMADEAHQTKETAQ